MRIQCAIISLAFLATAASAEHVYQGLAEGNPDLGERHQQVDTPVQHKAGGEADQFDMHHGLAGNPDLSPPPRKPDPAAKRSDGASSIDFHHGLSAGNPDLSPPPAR